MPRHTHEFVETYDGLVGFGLDRKTDESAVIWYLQKCSDDVLVNALVQRMTDNELQTVFNLLGGLLRKHLTDPEYHRLFLRDGQDG